MFHRWGNINLFEENPNQEEEKEMCNHLTEAGPQRENVRSVGQEELELEPSMRHIHHSY